MVPQNLYHLARDLTAKHQIPGVFTTSIHNNAGVQKSQFIRPSERRPLASNKEMSSHLNIKYRLDLLMPHQGHSVWRALLHPSK